MTNMFSMCLRKMIFLPLLFGFGYFDHQGTHGWWNQCPSYDAGTHECYELKAEVRSCVSYVVDCCEFDYDDSSSNSFCRLCMKPTTRPCLVYKCVSQGCCNGWFEDNNGRCTISVEEAKIECLNDGIWQENNTCKCEGHFTGTKCQKPICDPPCENDGVCELVEDKPMCVCPSKYFRGNFCEEIYCDYTCLNGGQCAKDGVIATCQCAVGYRGPACEVLTNGRCPIMPDDVQTLQCSRATHECYRDDDCHGDQVCCWDGCAGVCRQPDVIKCYHGGLDFSVGEIYKQSDCSVCVCQPIGMMECQNIVCKEVSCPGTVSPLPSAGQCCPRCPGTDPPPSLPEPKIINCPMHYVEALVARNSRVASIENLQLIAKDYAGEVLAVTFSQTYFMHSGQTDIRTNTHIVYAYSEPDIIGRRADCQVKVIVRDKYSPTFSSCPFDQWAENNEMVTWIPPVPSDNVGIYRLMVVGDEHLNKTLSAGVYSVSYTALDFDQNQAICSFMINVYEGHFWPPQLYKDEFPTGTLVGMTTGFIMVMFFSVWVCIRVRQNQKATDQAVETDTLASTVDSQATSTVYAMAGRVANVFGEENVNFKPKRDKHDIRMSEIKLPEYSPPVAPPAYEELAETEKHWGHSDSLPIYESIPEREETERNATEEPKYENVIDDNDNNNAVGGTHYENVANGTDNPTYVNIPE